MAYVITESCIGTAADSCRQDDAFPCVEACPVDGIHGFADDPQFDVNTDA